MPKKNECYFCSSKKVVAGTRLCEKCTRQHVEFCRLIAKGRKALQEERKSHA